MKLQVHSSHRHNQTNRDEKQQGINGTSGGQGQNQTGQAAGTNATSAGGGNYKSHMGKESFFEPNKSISISALFPFGSLEKAQWQNSKMTICKLGKFRTAVKSMERYGYHIEDEKAHFFFPLLDKIYYLLMRLIAVQNFLGMTICRR